MLAHETGHIAGGHLSKLRQELANVQTAALIGMLLGAAAIAAGSAVGGGAADGAGQAGMAAIMGSQHAAQRTLLSYQRAHEEAADRAAVKFLAATGQSAKGMYETFKRFADQSMFTARFADPYAQSHPMPTERIAALSEIARTSPNWDKKDPPELQARHDMMRAKLSGFMEAPQTRRAPLSAERHLAAGPLCARDRDLSPFRHPRRGRADRRPDRGAAEQSLLPRTEGPGPARRRPRRPKRSRRCAARCRSRPIPR